MGAVFFIMALIGLIAYFVSWARKDTDWKKVFSSGKSAKEGQAKNIGSMDYFDFCKKYKAGSTEQDDRIIAWLNGEEGTKWKHEFSAQFGYSCLTTELLLMAIYALQGKVYFRVINGIYLVPKNTDYKAYRSFLLWYNDELKKHGVEEMYYLYRHGCVRKRPSGGTAPDYFQRADKHFYNAMAWGKYAPSLEGDATIFWPSCADHTFIDKQRACDLY